MTLEIPPTEIEIFRFRGGLLELKNAVFADNAIGATFAHGGGDYQILNGAVIIGNVTFNPILKNK